jgi:hypothetical protein
VVFLERCCTAALKNQAAPVADGLGLVDQRTPFGLDPVGVDEARNARHLVVANGAHFPLLTVEHLLAHDWIKVHVLDLVAEAGAGFHAAVTGAGQRHAEDDNAVSLGLLSLQEAGKSEIEAGCQEHSTVMSLEETHLYKKNKSCNDLSILYFYNARCVEGVE